MNILAQPLRLLHKVQEHFQQPPTKHIQTYQPRLLQTIDSPSRVLSWSVGRTQCKATAWNEFPLLVCWCEWLFIAIFLLQGIKHSNQLLLNRPCLLWNLTVGFQCSMQATNYIFLPAKKDVFLCTFTGGKEFAIVQQWELHCAKLPHTECMMQNLIWKRFP